jgi:O-antigen/teichoic acid export membrane protein
MPSSLKKVNLFRNISEYDNSKIIIPTHGLEKTEYDRDTPADMAVAFRIDESMTLKLFAIDVDQIPTQAGLQAIFMPSMWSSSPTNGVPIFDQPTWQVPVIPESSTVSSQLSSSTARTTSDESYLGLIRNLAKSSGIYAISALASPLVSLVLAPFLTHSLSIADYGALIVLNTVITLVTTITQVGLNSAILRAYNYDYETRRDRLGVLSTAVILLSFISISVAIAIMLKAPEVASFLLGSSSFSLPVRITALAILAQNLSVPGLAWLRAENRAKVFSTLAIINLLITLGANIVLVGIAHLGITGSLLAIVAGYSVVVICLLPTILLRGGLVLRLDITKNLLSFGIPLVFNSVSFWVLQLSDRYLLSRLGSLPETASYGVAYTLGGALNAVVLAPFILAWPVAMFAIAKRSDAPQVFQLVFRWFSIILLLAAFILAFIAEAVLYLFFPPSYHSAAPIIPIIAMSAMFFGVYNIFAVGIGIRRKTWLAALIMTLSALVNSTVLYCGFLALLGKLPTRNHKHRRQYSKKDFNSI